MIGSRAVELGAGVCVGGVVYDGVRVGAAYGVTETDVSIFALRAFSSFHSSRSWRIPGMVNKDITNIATAITTHRKLG